METLSFTKDVHGNLLCQNYKPARKDGRQFLVKGKVILGSEAEAWKVTRKMTQKTKSEGTFKEDCPFGPYRCPGFPDTMQHWHIGQAFDNVGRKPSLKVEIQIVIRQLRKEMRKAWRKVSPARKPNSLTSRKTA